MEGGLTREETSLSNTEEPAGRKEAGKVGAQTHERHDHAPDDDDSGEEDAGCESLEQGVGGGLEDGVADEEDGERHVVVGPAHLEVIFHAGETRIANVGSVKEGE